MRLVLTVIFILKSFTCIKCQECRACNAVYFFKCLQDCSEVGWLYLNNSGYSTWDNLSAFPELIIYRVFLDDNMFKSLDYTTIPKGLTHVKTLYLKHNAIQEVPESVFSNMKNLTDLNLASNNITTIHLDAFKFNQLLKTLVLDDNSIKDISFLLNLKDIEKLYLSNNHIITLNVFYENKFVNIQYLYLNMNDIECIEKGFFENLPNIKDINLEQNKIHTIASTVRVKRMINLSNNQLNCFDFETTNSTIIKLEANRLFCEFIAKIEHTRGITYDQQHCKRNPNSFCNTSVKKDVEVERETHLLYYILIPVVVIGNIIIFAIIYVLCKKMRPRRTLTNRNIESRSSHTYEEIPEYLIHSLHKK